MRWNWVFLLCLNAPLVLLGQGAYIAEAYHYFGALPENRTLLTGSFDYVLESNRMSNELMNQAVFDGKINPATANESIDWKSDQITRLAGGVYGNSWLRLASEKSLHLLIGLEANDMTFLSTKNALAQLFLNGNAPFEDETLGFSNSKVLNFSYQGLGAGIEMNGEKAIIGATAQVLKVGRMRSINIQEGSFYTAPYGTELEATLKMDYISTATEQRKSGAWYGTGFSINTYLATLPINGGGMFTLQASNLGIIHFSGVRRFSADLDTTFAGIEINNVLAIDESFGSESGIDSLEAFIGLIEKNESHVQMLPAKLSASLSLPLGSKASLQSKFELNTFLAPPSLRIGFAWKLIQGFTIEPSLKALGYTRIDPRITLALNAKDRVRLYLDYGMLESQLVSSTSTSQGIRLSGQILF